MPCGVSATQNKHKHYADKSRREVNFTLGQEVLLSTKNVKFKGAGTPKLMPKWARGFWK